MQWYLLAIFASHQPNIWNQKKVLDSHQTIKYILSLFPLPGQSLRRPITYSSSTFLMGSCKQQQPPHTLWLRAQNLQFDICQSRQSLKARQRAEGCACCFQVAFQHHSIHVEECFKMQAMSKKKKTALSSIYPEERKTCFEYLKCSNRLFCLHWSFIQNYKFYQLQDGIEADAT